MTGDTFLLELADLLYKQGHDYAEMYLKGEALSRIPTRDRAVHCVNIAQGIKGPVVYYQQHPDKKYLDAVRKGFSDIRKLHGHAHGLYGGDEELHGANPSQGSELCSAVEMMFSLETMLGMTGDTTFADHLERIAFNALPTQVTDDFMYKQYYQQANQVMATRHARNFNVDQKGTGIVFGLLSGYPCCVSNMHQGWPKFTRNLWFATLDNGMAALVYSPSEVSATVGGGCRVRITEDTSYPVDDKITFTIKIEDDARREVTFPLHLRIPGWCKNAAITINGKPERAATAGEIAVVRRTWKSGDVLELSLPMEVAIDSWYENSMSVERGPLVYALRMTEQWTQKKFPPAETARFGDIYYEVTSTDKWNYGIIQFDANDLARQFKVTIDPIKQKADYFWNPQNAPIQIKARAREIPHWRLYNEMTGPIPHSRGNPGSGNPGATGLPEVEITLIPYGCTTLRISQFPVVR